MPPTIPVTVRMTPALALKLDAAVQAERESESKLLALASRSSITRTALVRYLEQIEAPAGETVAKP